MLINFSLSNYLSFDQEQTLSFEAGNQADDENYFVLPNTSKLRLLKIGIIYGANASGKTNFLKALQSLRDLWVQSPISKDQAIAAYQPFAFKPLAREQDCQMKLQVLIEDKIFEYKISFNQYHISYESLFFYPKNRAAKIFERKYDPNQELSQISFGETYTKFDKLTQNNLELNTPANRSFINTLYHINIHNPFIKSFIHWLNSYLRPLIKTETDLNTWTTNNLEKDPKVKNFIVDNLKHADFNISNLIIEKNKALKNFSILFQHQVESGKYQLSFEQQSTGTKQSYGLMGVLYELLHKPCLFLIDEIESSLHPDLLAYFLSTYLLNSDSSQILCSTHQLSLLSKELARQDCIWFVEKNRKTGASELFSAYDFDLDPDANLYHFYTSGKLGAKPLTQNWFKHRQNQNLKPNE